MIKKKSLLRTCVVIAAALIVCCFATATQANTIAVGSCKPNLVSYSTIQAAVTAAAPGTTIDVCPGIYPEQVSISKPLTLLGIAVGTADAAVIIPPATWVPNGVLIFQENGTPNALAQISVQNTSGVTISHITVDGANNGLSDCVSVGSLIGIYFGNASGTITDSVARNQQMNNGDQCGFGIDVESNTGSNTVTISDSSVSNFQKNGICARGPGNGSTNGPFVTVTANTVTGIGATSNIAENGIEIAFGASGSVTSNYVADVLYTGGGGEGNGSTGILFYAGGASTATSNVVESANIGIATVTDQSGSLYGGLGDGASIKSNHIGGTQLYDAIDLCSNNDTAESNFIENAAQSGIHIDNNTDGCADVGTAPNWTGDIVKTNTINSSCAGVLIGYATGNTTTPNTDLNVTNTTKAGDTCTPLASNVKSEGVGQKHRSFKPKP
jgi:hypothetical protein